MANPELTTSVGVDVEERVSPPTRAAVSEPMPDKSLNYTKRLTVVAIVLAVYAGLFVLLGVLLQAWLR